MKIGIIACSVTKLKTKAKARDLYQPSALFNLADLFARKSYDKVYYLSSKYGLIDPETEIEPYDIYVGSFRDFEIKEWSEKVISQIKELIPEEADLFLHIGEQFNIFTNYFTKEEQEKYKLHYPMMGLGGIGKQLQFYKNSIK